MSKQAPKAEERFRKKFETFRELAIAVGEEQAFEKTIPYRILFTRTSPAIATKLERQITAQLTASGVPMFDTHLNERSAYKAMFFYQRDLEELAPGDVNGLPAARDNAFRLAEELVNLVIDARAAA